MPIAPKRKGRKPKPYVCPWNNETIDGLYAGPKNRWRILATGQKFTEANPVRPVARFRQWQAEQRGDQRYFPIPFVTTTAIGPVPDAPVDDAAALEAVLRHELGSGEHRTPKDDSLVLSIPAGTDPVQLLRAIPEDAYYACVAEDIITKPKYVAERTGIEQLGYLPKLTKLEPSPTLDEVRDYFFRMKPKFSKNWKAKCTAS